MTSEQARNFRILAVLPEALFPLNSGGRISIFHEIKNMVSSGHNLTCLIFTKSSAELKMYSPLEALGVKTILIKQKGFLRSFFTNPILPYQMSSRNFRNISLLNLEIRTKMYDFILAHHDWTIPLSSKLQRSICVPIILRSHNDELDFFVSLFRNEQNLVKKLFYLSEAARYCLVRRFVQNKVMGVIAITKDLEHDFKAQGFNTVHCGPIVHSDDLVLSEQYLGRNTLLQIGFLGSLDMSHNVNGLFWFIDNVLPKIQSEIPQVRLLVAGRRASNNFKKRISRYSGVSYLGEISNSAEFYSQLSVNINPIFSGSGVNIKILEALQHKTPLVSTYFGMRGLEDLIEFVACADSVDKFANHCINLIKSKEINQNALLNQDLAIMKIKKNSLSESIERLVKEF